MSKLCIIGLTGSIGMGKSTASKILKSFGLPIHSADKAVHEALRRGGAGVKPVANLFPEALKRGAIDRRLLGQRVFASPAKLRKLEKILHPLVEKSSRRFLAEAKRKKTKAAVLEIPLLFETKAEKRCDVTICMTAPKKIQKERVMKRPGMTEARLYAILKQQMPDTEKRRRADYAVNTGKGLADTRKQLKRIWKAIQEKI